MDQGLPIETVILVAGFAVLVALAVWNRLQLDAEMEAMPGETRDRLGWSNPGGHSRKKHRRRITNRLMMRGLPDWVPLSAQGRRHLMWLRISGLGAALYLAVMPALMANAWGAVLFVGVPAVAILGVYGLMVGPWGDEQ
jgi:hypothetical protein